MNKISQAEVPPEAGASRLLLPVGFQPNPDKDILMSTTTTTSSLSFAARSSNALLHRTIENCLSQYRRQFSVLESSSRKQHFEAVATTLVNLFVGDGFRFIVVVASSAETSTSTGTSYYQVPLQEAIRAVQNHLMTRSFTLQAQDPSSTPPQGVVQAQQNNNINSHGSSADIIISTPKNFNSNAPASTSSSITPALSLITHATTITKNHPSLQESTSHAPTLLSSATTATTSRAPVIHADQSGGGTSAFDRWSPNTMHAATTLSMLSQNHHSNEEETALFDGYNHPTSTFASTTTPAAGPRQLWWASASGHRHHPNQPQGATSTMAPATISPETISTFMCATNHDDDKDEMIHCEDLDSESIQVDDDGSLIKCFPIGWASADYQDFVEDHAALYAKAKMGTKFDLCRSLLQSVLDDDGYTSFVNLGGRGRQGEHETLSIDQAALKLQKSFQAVNVKTPTAYDDEDSSNDSSSTEEESDVEGDDDGEDQKVFQVGLGNPDYQALIDDHVEAYANHTAGSKMDFCRALLNQLIEQEGYTTFLTAGRHDQDYGDEPMSLQQVAVKLQKAFGYAMFKATQAAEESSEYDTSSDIEQGQEEETDDESVTPPSRAVSSSKKKNKKQKVFELGRRSDAYQSFIEEHAHAYADTPESKMEFCRSLLNKLVQKEGYTSFVNTGHGLAQEPISFQEAASKLQKSLKYAVTKLQAATIQEPLPDFEFGPASQEYQDFVAEHLEDYKAADQRKKLAYCRELVSDLMEEYQIVARPFHHKDLEDDEDMDTLKELSEEEATAKLKQSFYHQSRKRKHGGSATSTAVAAGPTKKPKKKLASKPKPNNNKTKKAQELPLSLEDADLGPFDVVYGRGRDNHNPFLLQKVAEHAPVLAQADNKRQSMIEFVETLVERDGFRFIHEPNRDARRELVTSADRIVSKIQNDFRRLSQRQESNKTVVFGRGVKSDLNPDFLRLVKANGRAYQKANNKQSFMRAFAQSLLDDGWTFFRDSGEQVDDADRLAHLKIQNDFRRLLVNKTKGMSNYGE